MESQTPKRPFPSQAHETCLSQVGIITYSAPGVATRCPVCESETFQINVDAPMHYALRASIKGGPAAPTRTKQRRNHHAQSKIPVDANGQYPCMRRCGRAFSHAPAAIAHTKTCKYVPPGGLPDVAAVAVASPPPGPTIVPVAAPPPLLPPAPLAAPAPPAPPYNPVVRLPFTRAAKDAAAAAAAAAVDDDDDDADLAIVESTEMLA